MTGPAGLPLLTPGEKQASLLTLLFSLFNDNLEEYLIQKGNHCVTFEIYGLTFFEIVSVNVC